MPRPLAFNPSDALERATEVFWRQGFEATSLDDLTLAMGINRPSLYNTFGDKRSLYLQSLKHYRERHGAAMVRELSGAESVRAGFQRVFTAMAQAERACWGCLVVNAATELASELQEVRDFVNSAATENERAFAESIRSGQERGEVSAAKNPEALAKLLYNGMIAIRVRARGGAPEAELLENVELTLSLLD